MKIETKATPLTKKDEPKPITKESDKKQTPAAATKTSGDGISKPEQFGEKENPKVDPSSQALNQNGSGVNDGSKSYNAED